MSELTALRDAIAKKLAMQVKIPLVPKDLAVKLYCVMLERAWLQLPPQIRTAIDTATSYIYPEQMSAVMSTLRSVLKRHLPQVAVWMDIEEVDNVANAVASTLASMSANGVTAHTFSETSAA